MFHNGSAESAQLSMLARVLSNYCNEAGIPAWHPAKEQFRRRLMILFRSGINQPDDLKAQMNSGYDEWLGEIGATAHLTPPSLSTEDRLVDDNILPRWDLRGRPVPRKSNGG
ncbi:hypothetical protein NKI51_26040 [Mesorhizobium australicum]|uniref:Uncharacterized protein n=1 Tax=Mesorhizobium australicum TaxID=536018 RepID=A0ACC6T5C9_9HYPH|nr:hypothetical protein [Mesorhizobium sp. LNHC229A00]ESY89713.1 hypothetical protein X741_29355 [Mesorhizobium sp. LNHC229A00]